jgi:hypothetical protein
MDDQLRAAGFVEETLQYKRGLRGQHAERGLRLGEVFNDLLRGRFAQAQDIAQPVEPRLHATRIDVCDDFLAQPRYAKRQFVAASRRFAKPERNARWCALRIFHAKTVALDALDAIARVAELENVARHALDGEIFIHGADDGGLRFQYDEVIGRIRNGAAGCHGGKSRAASRTQFMVHGVAMHICAACPASCREAIGEHAHNRIELLAR